MGVNVYFHLPHHEIPQLQQLLLRPTHSSINVCMLLWVGLSNPLPFVTARHLESKIDEAISQMRSKNFLAAKNTSLYSHYGD